MHEPFSSPALALRSYLVLISRWSLRHMTGSLMRLIFRLHALRRMDERGVTDDDVRHILATGKVIEDYPDDFPYPSKLILGWCGDRPLHIVVATKMDTGERIVVTVYEPYSVEWGEGFERREQ